MINVAQIISEVQNEINDLAFERIQQGEYIDLLNSVAREIAQDTEVYINRYSTIPNPAALLWAENNNYTAHQIISYENEFYLILQAHTSSDTNKPDTTPTLYKQFNKWKAGKDYEVNDLVVDNHTFAIARAEHTADYNSRPTDLYGRINIWDIISGGNERIFDATLPYLSNDIGFSGYRILRVVRGIGNSWKECREYSSQSISATTSSNRSFPINYNQLGANEFSVQFVDRLNRVDGGLHLVFGNAFEANEICLIDFISNRPFGQPNLGVVINGIPQVADVNSLQRWLPSYGNSQIIPDFLENSFKYGLLSLVQQRLFNRGDDKVMQRSEITKNLYQTELRKAVAYAKMFKDNQSNLRAQPLNFLPEE